MLANLTPFARFAETALDARQTAVQRATDLLGDGALRIVAMQARFGAASLTVARHLLFGDASATAPAADAVKPAAKPAAKTVTRKLPAAKPAPVAEAVAAPVVEPAPAPVVETVATPATEPDAPAAVEAVAAEPDDLTALKGIGPKLSAVLNALGVTTYAQIAAWTPDDIVWFEDKLDFKGRVTREKWVEQAAAKLA